MFRSLTVGRVVFCELIPRRTIQGKTSTRTLLTQVFRRTQHSLNHTTSNRLNRGATTQQSSPTTLQFRYYSSDLPECTRVVLPALSPTMEEGTIISWAKKEGDKLNEGDLLAEIETDKATMAFETPEEGYLAKILVPAGTKGIPIGKLVCIIVENEKDVAAFKDYKDDATEGPKRAAAPSPPQPSEAPAPTVAAPAVPPAVSTPPPAALPSDPGARVYASPMAKRLAEQRNIRLQGRGTGLFGSITAADLENLPSGAAAPSIGAPVSLGSGPSVPGMPPGASFVDTPVSTMRATIAKRLVQSTTTAPHFYISSEIDISQLNRTRARINKMYEKQGVKLSINDFIIKATAMANIKVPEANSCWMDSVIRRFANVDVSVAVATPTGLITPIIFEANKKGILTISAEMKALAEKARANKLSPQEFQGGTICVSNLGMFPGVSFFTAIINPPQSAILAISASSEKLVEDNTQPRGFRKSTVMVATLSCDHRVLDGAVAAQWLREFKMHLEEPITMVL